MKNYRLQLIYGELMRHSLQLLAGLSFQLRCQYRVLECHASLTLHIERLCSNFDRVSVNFKERIAMQIGNSEHFRLYVESIMAKEQLILGMSICISCIECDVFWWLCANRREMNGKSFLFDFVEFYFNFVVFKVLSSRVHALYFMFYALCRTKNIISSSHRMLLDGRASIENATFAAHLKILLGLRAECHLRQL